MCLGNFGEVWLCQNQDKQEIALKCIKEYEYCDKERSLNSEALCLKKLSEPGCQNIVRFNCFEYRQSLGAFSGTRQLYLGMEFVQDGDLATYLEMFGPLSPQDVWREFVPQIFEALRFLKEHRIVHR